jgi:dTDP-4-amino-4,6-dideoxygalactose transaminase
MPNLEERTQLIDFMRKKGILAVFHYLSLHKSPFYQEKHDGRTLENCDNFSDTLIRLPFYYELTQEEIEFICNSIIQYFDER